MKIRKTGRTALPLLLLSLLLSACSSRIASDDAVKIFYSDESFVYLLDPSVNTDVREERQHLEGAYGERTFSSDSWMLLNDSTISLMLFSSMGNTIGELVYTKDSIRFESRWMDAKKVKPEYVLADIQFCYYPSSVLEENFRAHGFEFEEVLSDSVQSRTLSEKGRLLLKMERRKNEIRLENLLRNYRYLIAVDGAK